LMFLTERFVKRASVGPSFIKIGSGVQKSLGRYTNTYAASNVISYAYFYFLFHSKENRLKKREWPIYYPPATVRGQRVACMSQATVWPCTESYR
jgi:hypothetical protein